MSEAVAARTKILELHVTGLPESKGSWVHLANGKMRSDNPREKVWSETVGWNAKLAMKGRAPVAGAVAVELWFFLPPPVGRKNLRDVDKLVRSCLDALTRVVYNDDEQVTEVFASKEIAKGSVSPGVVLRVFES